MDLVASLDAQMAALQEEVGAAWCLLRQLRETLFAHGPAVPLQEVCSIQARLVDPRMEEHADLLHIGVDSMEKDTGRIVGARTAREDALVSSKFLFQAADVVYAKIRPALRKVSLPGFRALCSADAYPLTPKPGVPPSLLREALLHEPVVETVVGMSGRTKMPKVNRRELFSVEVPMPRAEDRHLVDGALLGVREQAEALTDELEAARVVRASMLTTLLSGDVEIGESYDDFATEAP